jgi:hypothetical protein
MVVTITASQMPDAAKSNGNAGVCQWSHVCIARSRRQMPYQNGIALPSRTAKRLSALACGSASSCQTTGLMNVETESSTPRRSRTAAIVVRLRRCMIRSDTGTPVGCAGHVRDARFLRGPSCDPIDSETFAVDALD